MGKIRKPGRRTPLLALVAAGALLGAARDAGAQARFDGLTAFGDSYADNGNVQRLLRGSSGYPSSTNDPAVTYYTFPFYLQQLYGVPDAGVRNYAIGGATTTDVNASAGRSLSLPFELQSFARSGQRIGANELVVFSIGGNDGGASSGQVSPAQAEFVAARANSNSLAAVRQLVDAGARTVVFRSTSDLGALASVRNGPFPESTIRYGQLYFDGLQRDLATLGDQGVRAFLFDTGRLLRAVQADPAAYGFVDAQTPCNTFAACRTPGSPLQSQYLSYDGLHLTSSGFALVARYIAAQIDGQEDIAAQSEVGLATITAFSNSVFERLDTYRLQGVGGPAMSVGGGMGGGGMGATAPAPVAPGSPVSVFVQGHYAGGEHDRRSGVAGFDYDVGGVTIGGEVRPAAPFLLGLALNYSNTDAHLDRGGSVKADSYAAALYASVSYPNWFVDAAAFLSHDEYDIRRRGVISALRSDPSGNSYGGGVRGAYLFGAGPVRVGPLAGLTYARSRIDGYSERGDGLLTNDVRREGADSLTGSAGAQLRLDARVAGRAVSPYLNLTAEHDFLDGDGAIATNAAYAPALPIRTRTENRDRTYGRVAGGISAEVLPGVSVMANGATSFARPDGNDYAFWGGVRLSF